MISQPMVPKTKRTKARCKHRAKKLEAVTCVTTKFACSMVSAEVDAAHKY